MLVDGFDGPDPVFGRGNDVDVVVLGEELAGAFADEGVIVGDDQPDMRYHAPIVGGRPNGSLGPGGVVLVSRMAYAPDDGGPWPALGDM